MKPKISAVLLSTLLLVSTPLKTRADLFGADAVVLSQILAQAIQQLYQLKQIFEQSKGSLELMRDINRGINDSLDLIRTVYPDIDPGIYREWDKIDRAMRGVQEIYGVVVPSLAAPVQRDTDQQIAEAIALNNSIYKYSQDIDEIGEAIKQYSHAVSPSGAQKLTAQSLGVMLNVLNQSLRAQATGLKIQAQALAVQNYKEKEATKRTLEVAETLSQSMKAQNITFEMPRF
ncbi:MAG: hypothetical protein AB7G93_00930 [Bdellovibrionales bacterium]